MGTIDSQGIYKYASSDVVAPLETTLNVGQQSVSDKFAEIGPGTIRYVANTAARNALAASYAPSASKPLYVYRGDAPQGRNLEFTLNGSTWDFVSDSRDDTGWVQLTSGVVNTRVRRVGRTVTVLVSVDAYLTDNIIRLNNEQRILPAEFCPSVDGVLGVGIADQPNVQIHVAVMEVKTNGVIIMIKPPQATSSLSGTASYSV